MPFTGQRASKFGHEEILKNPDVEKFLREHEDVERPSDDTLAETFAKCPRLNSFAGHTPPIVAAIDGSRYEASADLREPSRRVGYIKVGMVALDMEKYDALSVDAEPFVDPMAVNRLLRSNALSLALPGANMKRKEFESGRDGFRFYIHRYLSGQMTNIGSSSCTLLDTVIELARYLDPTAVKGEVSQMRIECVRCDEKDSLIALTTGSGKCKTCQSDLYATDMLRVHECFVDEGSNEEAFGRLMIVAEHLVAAHYVLHYKKNGIRQLSQIAIVMDGPLSLSGQAAKFHRPLMALLHDVNTELEQQDLPPMLFMGLSKSGVAMEHFANLPWPSPIDPTYTALSNFAYAVTDEYRYRYITPRPRKSNKPFGDEFYYGQDVLIRTGQGRLFLLSLPYPWRSKNETEFSSHRYDLRAYRMAGRAFRLVRDLETDLYSNALVPLILAHEYASISLAPGGKVLDLATARAVARAY